MPFPGANLLLAEIRNNFYTDTAQTLTLPSGLPLPPPCISPVASLRRFCSKYKSNASMFEAIPKTRGSRLPFLSQEIAQSN